MATINMSKVGVKSLKKITKQTTKSVFEVIEKSLMNSSLTIKDITEQTETDVRLYATDGVGLTIMVEFFHDNDNDVILAITDEGNEDNFAVMHPKKGNMRSLSACMRMCMNEIIENA